MKNQFVPYELAVKLKELGFNDTVRLAFYIKEDDTQFSKTLHRYNQMHHFIPEYCIKAPLWQQAFDWFWDNYEMWGECFPWNPKINNWKIVIFYKVNGEYNDSEYFINGNLNEARQVCLEKLIELCQE